MTRLITLCCLALTLTAANLQAKQIYQCPDARGNMHFSDGPCTQQALGSKLKPADKAAPAPNTTANKNLTPPATLTECDKTGCWSGKVRYTKVNQDKYVSSTGKSCKRVGNTMHCN